MHRYVAFAALIALPGCPGPAPPTPTPPPTTQPAPSPTPSPTPQPVTEDLGVTGNRFTVRGRDIYLTQAAFCCASPSPDCWPLACEDEIRLAADHGITSIHMRLGPFADEEAAVASGRGVDLAPASARGVRVTEVYARGLLQKLPTVLGWCERYGVRAELDALDGWAAKTGNLIWPDDRCNIMIQRPRPRHEAWLRDVVRVAASSPAAYFQVSNESGVCFPGDPGHEKWEIGVRDILLDEMGKLGVRRIVGTNVEMPSLDGRFDYASYHQRTPLTAEAQPRQVNEHNPPLPLADYLAAFDEASRRGTYWTAWRGWPPLSDQDWDVVLDHYLRYREAHP